MHVLRSLVFDWNAGLQTARLPLTRKGALCDGCPAVNQNPAGVRELRNYKQKVPSLWKCQVGKRSDEIFPFILTNDIFKVTFTGAIWKALGKNKTKNTKENKATPGSGSTWSGNMCVGRGTHVCTTAITRARLETWSGGLGQKAFFCTRSRGQTSLAVKLLLFCALSCTKESVFSLSKK